MILDQAFAYEIVNEGWLLAHGEQPPEINTMDMVEIMYRTGDVAESIRAGAVDWSWDRAFPTVDIIACRVVD